MHYEVDITVPRPLDDQSLRFLTDVQRSANQVLRFRGDDSSITLTVEAHAMDRDGAVGAARREVAAIYPKSDFGAISEPWPLPGPIR